MKRVFEEINVDANEESKFYWMYMECNNCSYRKSVAIPKGNTANGSTCPNCGCDTLEKVHKPYL